MCAKSETAKMTPSMNVFAPFHFKIWKKTSSFVQFYRIFVQNFLNRLEIKIERKSTLLTPTWFMYSPHLESKNIFRTNITKENFLIRIRSSFLCRFIVTLFPEKKKSINQPSNDCKKEWIFLSFCQIFFFQIKKSCIGDHEWHHIKS